MEPTNRQATPGARRLFHDLDSLKGRGILTGQHTQTVKMEEIDEIRKITGKEPALRGFELLAYSPNIRYETGDEACRTEIDENKDTIEHALAFGRRGGIVTFTWHWFSPMGGQDKSFYSHNTDFDPEKVLEEGSAERKAFYRDLDVIAGLLQPFLEEDIPILWRPFHESEGAWFWWGRKGPAVAAKLFRMQYEYFVGQYHLNNLLWVWNCPLKEGYPGDDVVDIFSCDLYEKKGTKTDYAAAYEQLRAIMGEEKPVALAEIGILPDMEMLEKSRVPWRYYMTWSKGFVLTEEFNSHEDLRRIYDSAYAITDPWKRGMKAPKDPEKSRPFFYIMRDKEVFGSPQPDGRGIQFIYENSGRMINSARIAGNVTDEEELTLMQSTEGFRRLVHSIGVSVETDDHEQEVVFAFQMYGKEDPMGGGTTIRKKLRADGAEARIVLSEEIWSADDKEPGQIRFEFEQSKTLALVSVRFFLNDGYRAPEPAEDDEIDFSSAAYREMIERSLMQTGNTARLMKAIEKAERGEETTLAYIGGSITQGAGATPINNECYAYKSCQRFAKRFGKGDNVRLVKAGVGGTPSELGMIRFERDVLRDGTITPDIVVVEFAVNDEGDETKGNCYESLVRKILTLPNAPAVVLLFAVFADDSNLQDRLKVVGERYHLPMVSVLNAVTPQFRLKPGAGRVISKNQFFYDMFHPTNAGHTVMADCLMHCFEVTKKQGAVGSVEENLPEPVIGADFETVRLLDKKDMPQGVTVTPGSFLFVDDVLQSVEMNEDLTGTPEFPHNWMYDGKRVKQGGDFTLEITCRALLLVFKDSGDLEAGRADIFVDGEKKLTADPHINGWVHCNPVILLQEKEAKRHRVSVRMASGDEEKRFTILGFGYVS